MRTPIESIARTAGALILPMSLLWPLTTRAETVRLFPYGDATIYEGRGDLAQGTGSRLFAGGNKNGELRRALLQFDVGAAVPLGSRVTRVALELHVERTSGGAVDINLHRVTSEWTEGLAAARGSGGGQGSPASGGDVTWTFRSFDRRAWTTPGGDFVAEPSVTMTVDRPDRAYVFSSPRLLEDVVGWLERPETSHGFILRSQEDGNGTTKAFSSRESPEPARRPVLLVEFEPPPGSGACCAADGRCALGTAERCGDRFLGMGAECLPNPCPQPQGACCLPVPEGTCVAGTRATCETMSGDYLGEAATCTPNPCRPVLEPYVDPLPRLPVARPTSGVAGGEATYRLIVTQFEKRLHRDLPPTTVWGFDDGSGPSAPGPVIEARRGAAVNVTWVNDLRGRGDLPRIDHVLPVDACVDGSVDEARALIELTGAGRSPDGEREAPMLPGERRVRVYDNQHPAAMLLYRDQTPGMSRLNAYMGLTGPYIIREEDEEALDLPSGELEVALVIEDRALGVDGDLAYPASWQEQVFGHVLLVNGVVWPRLDVKPTRYRFRVANASNGRTLTLALEGGFELLLLGTDRGLLPQRRLVSSVTLAPGERVDVSIGFRNAAGRSIALVNASGSLQAALGGGPPLRPVMRFDVSQEITAPGGVPVALGAPAEPDETDGMEPRELVLGRGKGGRCVGAPWGVEEVSAREAPRAGAVEVWQVFNTSDIALPFTLDGAASRVLERRTFTSEPGGRPTPSDLLEAWPTDGGPEDTVLLGPGHMARLRVHIDPEARALVLATSLLEARDHALVRTFEVLPAVAEPAGRGEADEGGACDCRSTTSTDDPTRLIGGVAGALAGMSRWRRRRPRTP